MYSITSAWGKGLSVVVVVFWRRFGGMYMYYLDVCIGMKTANWGRGIHTYVIILVGLDCT